MIENKFLCYQTTEEFLKEKSSIADTSIVFVLDQGFIYTHGVTFFDPQITATLTQALGYLEERINENEKTLGAVFNNGIMEKLGGIEDGAQVNTVTSVAGKTGAVRLVKGDVGLGNVDNTADLSKPISTATKGALDGKVDKVSGKGLSSNDFTTEEKNKLAEVGLTDDISTAAVGALKSRMDMMEDTMGTVIAELRLEIQKLKE